MEDIEKPTMGEDCRRAAGRADRLSAAASGETWISRPDDLVSGWYVIKRGTTRLAYAETRDDAALIATYDPQVSNLVGELLRAAGADADMIDACNNRHPDDPGTTRILHSEITLAAWRLGRALLGGAV